MKRFLWSMAVLGASLSTAVSCLWDRDTLRDELKTETDTFDLITGQFPHHGDEYYRRRIEVLQANEAKLGLEERNDLAVAYIRLKRFDEGRAILLNNLKQEPGDYFTLSNLGVCAKKEGRFQKAADYIERALEVRREGHLGLGDWYLKRLRYRAALDANPEGVPKTNFLVHLGGSSYDFPGWLVLPLERFGHGSIVVFDEIEDLRV